MMGEGSSSKKCVLFVGCQPRVLTREGVARPVHATPGGLGGNFSPLLSLPAKVGGGHDQGLPKKKRHWRFWRVDCPGSTAMAKEGRWDRRSQALGNTAHCLQASSSREKKGLAAFACTYFDTLTGVFAERNGFLANFLTGKKCKSIKRLTFRGGN